MNSKNYLFKMLVYEVNFEFFQDREATEDLDKKIKETRKKADEKVKK